MYLDCTNFGYYNMRILESTTDQCVRLCLQSPVRNSKEHMVNHTVHFDKGSGLFSFIGTLGICTIGHV